MLVLNRKANEKIFIGHNREIEIIILEVKGGQVRLGINAPNDVSIVRAELLPKKN